VTSLMSPFEQSEPPHPLSPAQCELSFIKIQDAPLANAPWQDANPFLLMRCYVWTALWTIEVQATALSRWSVGLGGLGGGRHKESPKRQVRIRCLRLSYSLPVFTPDYPPETLEVEQYNKRQRPKANRIEDQPCRLKATKESAMS